MNISNGLYWNCIKGVHIFWLCRLASGGGSVRVFDKSACTQLHLHKQLAQMAHVHTWSLTISVSEDACAHTLIYHVQNSVLNGSRLEIGHDLGLGGKGHILY